MLEELIDLSAGVGVMLLPALLLAIPGIILFVVLPAILLLALAAPLALIGALLAAPYLLWRRLRRRRPRTPSVSDEARLPRPAGRAYAGLRPHRSG